MFTTDDYWAVYNARPLQESISYDTDEVDYILENYSIDEIVELIEAKSITGRVKQAILDYLGNPKHGYFSPQNRIARGIVQGRARKYAEKAKRKPTTKIDSGERYITSAPQNEAYEAIVEYLFVEGYTDTIEAAELMAESISDSWAHEILEDSNTNWAMVRRSATVRRDNVTPIRVGKTPILKSTDVKPVDPEVAARRAKRGKMSLPEIR